MYVSSSCTTFFPVSPIASNDEDEDDSCSNVINMDTTALRWFQEVADGVTVTEVSDVARVSQSGVSRALARLEDEVGTELLRRSGRMLRMTEAGAVFKRHVDALIHQLDDGLAAVQQVIDPETGTITLAFDPWLGSRWVPVLLSEFRVDHPSVRFHMVTQQAGADGTLERGDVDVEVTASRPSPTHFGWHPVAREPLHLVVPSGHPLATSSSVAFDSLGDESFVAPRTGSTLRGITDRVCAEAGFTPRVEFECDHLAAVHGFVAAGLGIAITPISGRRDETPNAGLRFLPLSDAPAVLEIGVAWPLQRRLLPAATAFLAHLRRPRNESRQA